MSNEYSLGPTCRARRVNDVGQVVRRRRGLKVFTTLTREDGIVCVEANRSRRRFWKAMKKIVLCQDHSRLRVFDHETNALGRVFRIEREVRSARFQYCEQSNQHLERTIHEDSDD